MNALRVLALLRSARPVAVTLVCLTLVAALVQTGTQVHEPLRLVNESRQNVGSQRIHSKNMRQAVLGVVSSRLSVSHAGIVNDGV